MLVTASAGLRHVILWVHIVAVIEAFAFYAILPLTVGRQSPQGYPRIRVLFGRTVLNPSLIIALAAGIYLASDEHQWQQFYVQWGIAAIVIIFGIEGALITRGYKRVIERATERGTGSGLIPGPSRLTQLSELAAAGIVVLTAIFMVVKP